MKERGTRGNQKRTGEREKGNKTKKIVLTKGEHGQGKDKGEKKVEKTQRNRRGDKEGIGSRGRRARRRNVTQEQGDQGKTKKNEKRTEKKIYERRRMR